MTPYTPTEVEALARELRLQAWHSDPRQFATWILTRFVRREEHERLCAEVREWLCETCRFVYPGPPMPGLRCVVCPQCSGPTAPRHTVEMRELRAELKGQRCDGSGNIYYRAPGQVVGEDCRGFCPRCPACKPAATPKGDECPHEAWETARGGFGRKCADCGQWLSDDGGRTRESVLALEQHRSSADLETIAKLRDESYANGYSAGRDDAARLNPREIVHVTKLHEDTVRALAVLMTDRGGEKLLAMLGEVKP